MRLALYPESGGPYAESETMTSVDTSAINSGPIIQLDGEMVGQDIERGFRPLDLVILPIGCRLTLILR